MAIEVSSHDVSIPRIAAVCIEFNIKKMTSLYKDVIFATIV
jgi:hypothetical protein